MFWSFKSCPKCKGSMFWDSDMDGEFWKCIQCGYTRYETITLSQDEGVALRNKFGVREIGNRGKKNRPRCTTPSPGP